MNTRIRRKARHTAEKVLKNPRIRYKAQQAAGKIRRFLLLRFKKDYVDRQLGLRRGECNQCGNCCEILFKCPFLVKLEDGLTVCSIYEDRPGQCAAFPIDEKCLSEVNFDCSYSFPPQRLNLSSELLQIDPPGSPRHIENL